MISAARSALLVVTCAALAHAEARWIRIESPNFEMFSSAGERGTRDTLRHFEQVRAFCVQALLGGQDKPFPVRIVAFGSKKDYEAYRFNEFATAYYHPGAERDYIVLSEAGYETFPTAVHEYMHLVMQHAGLKLPPWFNEGLAEVYSTLKPQGEQVLVGNLIAGRVQALNTDKWVPLAAILNADHDSPYYNEKAKAGSLYNEGWALVHMLMLSPEYRPSFAKFYELLTSGKPSVNAIQESSGKPIAMVERDLQAYLRGDRFRGMLFPVKLTKVSAELAAVPAVDFEVKLMLADIGNRPGRETQTRQSLEELMRVDPKRSEPYAALAYLEWHAKNRAAARDQFAKAFDMGSRSPRLLFDYANLAWEDPPQAIRAFHALLEQQPDHLEARLRLAQVQLNARMSGEALTTLAPVKKIGPEEAPRLFRLMAYAQMQSGLRKEALEAAERFASFAKTDNDRAEAKRLIDALTPRESGPVRSPDRPAAMVEPKARQQAQSQSGAEARADERPKLERRERPGFEVTSTPDPFANLPSATGKFVSFDCSGPKPRVVLQTDKARLTFLIEDPNNILVEHKKGGQVELTCGPQKGTSLRVVYEAKTGSSVSGAVRALYFEP